MALMIRLRQQGNKNSKTYRLVVMKKTAPRDGRYIECLGWYNPNVAQDASFQQEKVEHWLQQGAQLSDKAQALIKRECPSVWQSFVAKKQAAKLLVKKRKKQQKLEENG